MIRIGKPEMVGKIQMWNLFDKKYYKFVEKYEFIKDSESCPIVNILGV